MISAPHGKIHFQNLKAPLGGLIFDSGVRLIFLSKSRSDFYKQTLRFTSPSRVTGLIKAYLDLYINHLFVLVVHYFVCTTFPRLLCQHYGVLAISILKMQIYYLVTVMRFFVCAP